MSHSGDRKGAYKDHRLWKQGKQHVLTLLGDWVYKINKTLISLSRLSAFLMPLFLSFLFVSLHLSLYLQSPIWKYILMQPLMYCGGPLLQEREPLQSFNQWLARAATVHMRYSWDVSFLWLLFLHDLKELSVLINWVQHLCSLPLLVEQHVKKIRVKLAPVCLLNIDFYDSW